MRGPLAITLALVALLAAGCGVRNSKPFEAKSTAGCLAKKGFTGVSTDPARVGFIASFAPRGGIKATSPTGNVLTVAFAEDADTVADTVAAFKRLASPFYRKHISDILETDRNAVLVWSVTPDQDELRDAEFCLRS